MYTRLLTLFYRALLGKPIEVPEGDAEALILIADGVGGLDPCTFGLRHVVGRDGATPLVRGVSWGHGWGRWHADLSNVTNHREQSAALAEQVMAWRADHPGHPAFLVGKSGGTRIVVGALEALPEGAVDAVVLLAPALSPVYNLSRALRAVDSEMTVFWSPLDVVILGVGTLLFGTVDRVHSVGAGLVGFQVPTDLDDEGKRQYAKLRQIRWRPEMASSGYLGGHLGTDHPAFLRKYIVPLLRTVAAKSDTEPASRSSHPRPAPINQIVGAKHSDPCKVPHLPPRSSKIEPNPRGSKAAALSHE